MIPTNLHARLDVRATWVAIRELVLGLDDPRLRREILDDTLPGDVTLHPFDVHGRAEVAWSGVPLGRVHWTACVACTH